MLLCMHVLTIEKKWEKIKLLCCNWAKELRISQAEVSAHIHTNAQSIQQTATVEWIKYIVLIKCSGISQLTSFLLCVTLPLLIVFNLIFVFIRVAFVSLCLWVIFCCFVLRIFFYLITNELLLESWWTRREKMCVLERSYFNIILFRPRRNTHLINFIHPSLSVHTWV